jgi:hypothetical protein
MRYIYSSIITFTIISLFTSCSKKIIPSTNNWEDTIINTYPEQQVSADEQSYATGKYILDNTYRKIRDNDNTFDWGDYFNLALGLSFTDGKKEDVTYSFNKAIELNEQNSCRMINSFDDQNQYHITLKKTLENIYLDQVEKCKN